MERAVVFAQGGRVEVEDLPGELRSTLVGPAIVGGGIRRLDEIEKEYILAAVKLNGGNQALTAQELGIGSATLYRRLKRYGLIADRAAPKSDRPR
jgi:transcriptional regulator of acetoin/glycerol metabolism